MQRKNKLTAIDILQVMETFKKQEKKEAKLPSQFSHTWHRCTKYRTSVIMS